MFNELSVVTLGVKNLKKATDFYIHGLKLPRMEWAGEDITFVKLDNLILSLFEINDLAKDIGIPNNKGTGFSGITFAYKTPDKETVEALYKQAVAAGAKGVTPPVTKAWGGYSAYICDPDGYYWEIVFNPFF